MKMQSISAFLDILQIVDLQWKNVYVSRTQRVFPWFECFFGSSLGKI